MGLRSGECIDAAGALNADDFDYDSPMAKYQSRGLLGRFEKSITVEQVSVVYIGFAVLLILACFVTAAVVLSEIYVKKGGIKGRIPEDDYPGIAILLQTIGILLATVSMRVARSSEEH